MSSSKADKFNSFVKSNIQSISTGTPHTVRRERLTKSKVTDRLLAISHVKSIRSTLEAKSSGGIISNAVITGDRNG